MRVLGLKPKTYGLKGRSTTHKCLSLLVLYSFFYVIEALHNYSTLGADCQQRQNRDKNDVYVTYEVEGKERQAIRQTQSSWRHGK